MSYLLRLKHWQLFLLIVMLPFLLQIFFAVLTVLVSPSVWAMPVTMIVACLPFLWFFSLGVNLHSKLPPAIPMNLGLFKFALVFPAVYAIVFIIGFASLAHGNFKTYMAPDTSLSPGVVGAIFCTIIILHITSMGCVIYALYFTAKELKAVELRKPVGFADFAGEFFLIWFFPLGVWFLQPRINEIFSDEEEVIFPANPSQG